MSSIIAHPPGVSTCAPLIVAKMRNTTDLYTKDEARQRGVYGEHPPCGLCGQSCGQRIAEKKKA
jgi:hypothetical protein